MIKSCGNEVLDANSILFVLSNWEAPDPPPTTVITKTIEYRMKRRIGDSSVFNY